LLYHAQFFSFRYRARGEQSDAIQTKQVTFATGTEAMTTCSWYKHELNLLTSI
jgi:hypothetical protein